MHVELNMGLSRRHLVFLGGLFLPVAHAARFKAGEDPAVIEVFHGINAIRREHGLGELSWNSRIAAAARTHAGNMAERDFFSHTDPMLGDLRARLDRAGIDWNCCAENLFEEQGFKDPVAMAIENWKNSPGHFRNILNPKVSETGVGLVVRSDGSHWLDQIFVRP